jgi:hypothetical protein
MTEMRIQAQSDRSHEITSSMWRRAMPGAGVFRGGVWMLVSLLACGLSLVATAGDDGATGAESAELVEVDVEGVVGAPMEVVRAVLLDLEGFPRWYPATGLWQVLERGPASALVYGRQSLPWPIADRDYVVRYSWRSEPEGDFVLVARLVTDMGPEPGGGVVRVPYLLTEWRIRPHREGTAVVYRYRGHPGGSLPVWAMRAGWRSQTGRVIDGLREEVERVRAKNGL